ncbi:MAG: hypothetical protein ACOCWQ_02305 [Nanoarchaeota archaeon]
MVFTVFEILDMFIMSFALGFIFKDIIRSPPKPQAEYDPLAQYEQGRMRTGWAKIWMAAAVVAPGIILHELAHKFSAMLMGAQNPMFFAACSSASLFGGPAGLGSWSCNILILAIVLKLLNFGFLFFVPGFVAYPTAGISALASSFIAFTGPLMNLLFWGGARLLISRGKVKREWLPAAVLFARINGFLFVLNMLPIPGFDGWHVFAGILGTIF